MEVARSNLLYPTTASALFHTWYWIPQQLGIDEPLIDISTHYDCGNIARCVFLVGILLQSMCAGNYDQGCGSPLSRFRGLFLQWFGVTRASDPPVPLQSQGFVPIFLAMRNRHRMISYAAPNK